MLKKNLLTKKLLLLLLMILVSSYVPLSVQASDDSEVIIDLEDTVVESTVLPLLRGTYLSSGSLKLQNNGNGACNILGVTYLNRVSTAIVSVSLQRLVSGSWLTYKSWSNTVEGASLATVSATLTVPTGYYYRLSGIFTAKMGTVTESMYDTTGSLYFN